MRVDIFGSKRKYDLILADPPWKQSKGGKRKTRPKQNRSLDYPTCSLEEIAEHLRVATDLTEDNAVLFLWTIDKFLFEAEVIAENLGYKLHARMIWNKENGVAPAFTLRYAHEYLLFFYKGKLPPIETNMRGKICTVFTERAKRHSQKPEISFEIIESLYPYQRKLELYARKERKGWDCWGNEVPVINTESSWLDELLEVK